MKKCKKNAFFGKIKFGTNIKLCNCLPNYLLRAHCETCLASELRGKTNYLTTFTV